MFQPVTYQTALLLARGVSATALARIEGVTVGAIHLRRRRFDKYAGGVTPRVGKRGRPRKGETVDDQIRRLESARRKEQQAERRARDDR